jgi:hypothetical protein
MIWRALALGAATAATVGSIAIAAAAPDGGGAGFELANAKTRPAVGFFDAARPVRLRFSFDAERPLDLVIRVVRVGDGKAVRRWVERDLAPGRLHRRRWDGRRGDGGVPADGTYEFRLGPLGHHGAAAGRFEFHDHRFPVAGPHSYGDRFGEPRSGGRVHEGQDLPSPCGTPLLAARGGRVLRRGHDAVLYGNFVLIHGRGEHRSYFYAHMRRPAPVRRGERVRTGERVGSVGETGNASTVGCHLHFEIRVHGMPVDPEPSLRRWDRFS